MPRCIVSLSGGVDSATLLAYVKRIYDHPNAHPAPKIQTVAFDYGSKHNHWENEAAEAVAKHYDVPFNLLNVRHLFCGESSLLLAGGKIPEGHYEAENMKATVVPGRNMIFASILAGIAAALPHEGMSDYHGEVQLGIHAGDHYIYPDCRPAFFQAMRMAIALATNKNKEGKLIQGVELGAPFLHKTKKDIIQIGLSMNVPYHLTRTCYTNNEIACGKCGSCVERREAFWSLQVPDPIEYEYTGPLPTKSD